MVFNWLEEEFKPYKEFGIEVYKMEKNGDIFSIFITGNDSGVYTILQMSFDFVKYAEPYQGHIRYGAYGADILFWVGNHAPKAGLNRLVISEVDREVARIKKLRAETV